MSEWDEFLALCLKQPDVPSDFKYRFMEVVDKIKPNREDVSRKIFSLVFPRDLQPIIRATQFLDVSCSKPFDTTSETPIAEPRSEKLPNVETTPVTTTEQTAAPPEISSHRYSRSPRQKTPRWCIKGRFLPTLIEHLLTGGSSAVHPFKIMLDRNLVEPKEDAYLSADIPELLHKINPPSAFEQFKASYRRAMLLYRRCTEPPVLPPLLPTDCVDLPRLKSMLSAARETLDVGVLTFATPEEVVKEGCALFNRLPLTSSAYTALIIGAREVKEPLGDDPSQFVLDRPIKKSEFSLSQLNYWFDQHVTLGQVGFTVDYVHTPDTDAPFGADVDVDELVVCVLRFYPELGAGPVHISERGTNICYCRDVNPLTGVTEATRIDPTNVMFRLVWPNFDLEFEEARRKCVLSLFQPAFVPGESHLMILLNIPDTLAPSIAQRVLGSSGMVIEISASGKYPCLEAARHLRSSISNNLVHFRALAAAENLLPAPSAGELIWVTGEELDLYFMKAVSCWDHTLASSAKHAVVISGQRNGDFTLVWSIMSMRLHPVKLSFLLLCPIHENQMHFIKESPRIHVVELITPHMMTSCMWSCVRDYRISADEILVLQRDGDETVAYGPLPLSRVRCWSETAGIEIIPRNVTPLASKEFLQGSPPSLGDIPLGATVARTFQRHTTDGGSALTQESLSFQGLKDIITHCQRDNNCQVITLYHEPGMGGSTAALSFAFQMRDTMPVCRVRIMTTATVSDVVRALEEFQVACGSTSILVLVDTSFSENESIPYPAVEEFLAKVEQKSMTVMVVVRSSDTPPAHPITQTSAISLSVGILTDDECEQFARVFSTSSQNLEIVPRESRPIPLYYRLLSNSPHQRLLDTVSAFLAPMRSQPQCILALAMTSVFLFEKISVSVQDIGIVGLEIDNPLFCCSHERVRFAHPDLAKFVMSHCEEVLQYVPPKHPVHSGVVYLIDRAAKVKYSFPFMAILKSLLLMQEGTQMSGIFEHLSLEVGTDIWNFACSSFRYNEQFAVHRLRYLSLVTTTASGWADLLRATRTFMQEFMFHFSPPTHYQAMKILICVYLSASKSNVIQFIAEDEDHMGRWFKRHLNRLDLDPKNVDSIRSQFEIIALVIHNRQSLPPADCFTCRALAKKLLELREACLDCVDDFVLLDVTKLLRKIASEGSLLGDPALRF